MKKVFVLRSKPFRSLSHRRITGLLFNLLEVWMTGHDADCPASAAHSVSEKLSAVYNTHCPNMTQWKRQI